jgi:hypothetical protein
MPKTKKRGSSKRKKTKKSSPKSENLQKILIENFVTFQKVMINLSIKFEELSKKISELLDLFEVSAKTLAEKDISPERGDETKQIIEKMNTLLDQNKVIARGLTLMHESVSGSAGSGSYETTPPRTPVTRSSPPPMEKIERKIQGSSKSLRENG